jgi:uncharacterized membrane protein YeaQ/YmgE (transglycosylase-associated protein family)
VLSICLIFLDSQSDEKGLFADRILCIGVGLFVGVWVARYLGVQQLEVFNYATIVV